MSYQEYKAEEQPQLIVCVPHIRKQHRQEERTSRNKNERSALFCQHDFLLFFCFGF